VEAVTQCENLFSELELPKNAKTSIHNNILTLTLWNWDYAEFLKFQTRAHEFIRKNKSLKVYIFCNHPHVYTLGRGNERGEDNLVDFNPQKESSLPYDVFKIHRGGGVTFHHPGQWIFYPITAIKESYTLDDHMCWLLKSVTNNLKRNFSLDKAMTAKKLMGVWIERRKLASIGVGVNRFVTMHGLALSLHSDDRVALGLGAIHPCGMNSDIYTSVQEAMKSSESNLIERFHASYLEQIELS